MKPYFIFLFLLFLSPSIHAGMATYNGLNTYTNFTSPDKSKTNLVFIHGSPGTYKAFQKYYEDPQFNNRFNMLSLDRPGFGDSNNFVSTTHPDLSAQAFLIAGALKLAYGVQANIDIVGHSYGAPLAVLVAKQLDGQARTLILTSGPFSPKEKVLRWYHKLASYWPLTLILPKSILTTSQEMLVIDKTLELAVPVALYNFIGKAIFIHGQNDGIVPFEHSKWAHAMRIKYKRQSLLYPIDGGHFVLWTQADKIKKIILDTL